MCGRYSLFDQDDNIEIRKIIRDVSRKYQTDVKTGEIFPSDRAPVLLAGPSGIEAEAARWGFKSYKGSRPIINARAETAAQKNMFKQSLMARRCAVPTTGFYEWTKTGEKQKYIFNLPQQKALYLAGFYNYIDGERRFVILTTAANSSVLPVHDRMPVLFSRRFAERFIYNTEEALRYLHQQMPMLIKSRC